MYAPVTILERPSWSFTTLYISAIPSLNRTCLLTGNNLNTFYLAYFVLFMVAYVFVYTELYIHSEPALYS